MLKKVLIANRGEIAVRIIRACREMGIRTVAIYSEADRNALHVQLADEAICVRPAPSSKSYLNVKAILEAACLTGADSIHPGFGFLSENPNFAKICQETGIKFIGPDYKLIELLGNKSKAKETMKRAKTAKKLPAGKEPGRESPWLIPDILAFFRRFTNSENGPMGRPFPQPPQGCAGAVSRVWLFWAGSSMQRCTAVVVNVCGRARILGHGPTYFLLASSSASSNVARVFSPIPRAMPGSRAPTM